MLEWLSFNETGGKNMYDFILKNGNVIDVKNEKIDQADIAVKDGKITGVGHFSGENEIDCTGKYIAPGFIDAHVHIEQVWQRQWNFQRRLCRMERQQ